MLRLLGIAIPIALIAFTLVWAVSTRVSNYGFLDVIWSLSVAILSPIYLFMGNGSFERKLAYTIIGSVWSLRLGLYILVRVVRHHPAEDSRYRTLREKWRGPWQFLAFFELQALIGVVFSLPFLLTAIDSRPHLTVLEIAGLLLSSIAIAGESIADWQAQKFKRDPANRTAIVNVGLWRYSRHPNYFFESLVWWGFFLAAVDSPGGWVTVVCPLLMLYLLLNVTGIPLTEKHSLEKRGDAYREYQRTTSRFIPWPPKPSMRAVP